MSHIWGHTKSNHKYTECHLFGDTLNLSYYKFSDINTLFLSIFVQRMCNFRYVLAITFYFPTSTVAISQSQFHRLLQASLVWVHLWIQKILLVLLFTIFCPITVLPLQYHSEQGAAGLHPRYSGVIHTFQIEVFSYKIKAQLSFIF